MTRSNAAFTAESSLPVARLSCDTRIASRGHPATSPRPAISNVYT
jgi:hypothetical protein